MSYTYKDALAVSLTVDFDPYLVIDRIRALPEGTRKVVVLTLALAVASLLFSLGF